MFNKNTVVVVGAGASCEFSIPAGSQLKKNIADLLDIRFENGYHQSSGDRKIASSFQIAIKEDKWKSKDINGLRSIACSISKAMPQASSIDNFIDSHRGNTGLELCGKLAIAKAILDAERNSSLFCNSQRGGLLDFSRLSNTWVDPFFHLLTENCTVDELPERLKKFTFVIFNYDRCIEHYLLHALQNFYGITWDHAANIVKSVVIFHPYGQVGSLPMLSQGLSVEFGGDPDPAALFRLASEIRTFTEGTDSASSDIDVIREKFGESHIKVFLGFAYHRQNMRLLRSANHHWHASRGCFGTAFGISATDCSSIRNDLSEMTNTHINEIHIHNELKCGGLLREHWRSLSLSD